MHFLAFLDGTSGVRGFLVASADGETLASGGDVPRSPWSAERAALVARDLTVAGALAGLGGFSSATVKGAQSSRLLAQRQEIVALIELDLARATADLEAQLQSTDWVTESVAASPEPSREEAELETLPPRPLVPPRPRGAERSPTAAAPVAAAPARPPGAAAALTALTRRAPGAPMFVEPLVPRPRPVAPADVPRLAVSSPQLERPKGAPILAVAKPASKPEPPPSSTDADVRASSPFLTGSLGIFALPDLLEFLRVGQRTGTLACASEAGQGIIQLRRGRITGASAPAVPGLGDWLVQRSVISRSQLREALRRQMISASEHPLGTTLVSENLISREALHEALVMLVGCVLRKLMSWQNGEFTFDPAGNGSASDFTLDIEIDPQSVLLNIFKELDDSQRA